MRTLIKTKNYRETQNYNGSVQLPMITVEPSRIFCWTSTFTHGSSRNWNGQLRKMKPAKSPSIIQIHAVKPADVQLQCTQMFQTIKTNMSADTKISADEDYIFFKSTQERRPKDMRMRRSILTKKLGISTNTKPVPVITKSGTSFLLMPILPTSQILFSLFQLNMMLYM